MFVEVESNPNCEQSIFLRFKEVGPPRLVTQVRITDRQLEEEWCWVTGWGDAPDVPACPARSQIVEDSGSGLAYLVYGGICGIRLKRISMDEPWNVNSPHQWGEPYLLLANAADIRCATEQGMEPGDQGPA